METPTPTQFALLRFGLGLKQYDVARKSGISASRLSKIEKGLKEPNDLDLVRILDALGPAAKDLLPLAGEFAKLLSQAAEAYR